MQDKENIIHKAHISASKEKAFENGATIKVAIEGRDIPLKEVAMILLKKIAALLRVARHESELKEIRSVLSQQGVARDILK